MTHPIDPLLRRRHVVLMILRSFALLLLVIAVYSLAYPIVRSVQMGQGLNSIGVLYGSNLHAWFGMAVGTLVPGVILALFSQWFARWIVPGIREECTHCGHEIGDHAGERCTECGGRLRH